MLGILAQTTSNPADIGTYMQNIFQQVIGIDVMLAFRLLGVWVFIIWLVFALWVAVDASARYRNWQVAVLWFLFVLPFNILGLIGYLFMRPAVTIDEQKWTKLESKYLMHELSSVNDCPTCGTLVPVSNNFCGACGTQMNINCPKCESLQSIYTVFCSSCGERLGEVPQQNTTIVITEKRPSLFHKVKTVVNGTKENLVTKVSQFRENLKTKKVTKQEKKSKKDSSEKKAA